MTEYKNPMLERWQSKRADERMSAHRYISSDTSDDPDEQLELIDLGYGGHDD